MKKKDKFLIVILLSVIGITPIFFHWLIIGRIPSISSTDAINRLSKGESLLIDVRDSIQYNLNHIDGSLNYPFSKIKELKTKADTSFLFQKKSILFICNSGISSAVAAKKLRDLSFENAFSVSGGIQAWTSNLNTKSSCKFQHLLNDKNINSDLFKNISTFEQLFAFSAAFIIKPLYLILSLILILLIRNLRSLDSISLRYSLIFFFLGEMFCAVNYLFYSEHSNLFEYLHIYGMVLGFCFFTFSLLEGMDKRILHFSQMDRKCSLLNVCCNCYKYTEFNCRLKKCFIVFVASCFIISFIPILSSMTPNSYNTSILESSYNYSHPVIFQILEFRILPLIAIAFFSITFISLLLRKNNVGLISKLLFAGGIGFIGFSMFRLIFYKTFFDGLTWFVAGEEVTELIYIFNIGYILLVFVPIYFI